MTFNQEALFQFLTPFGSDILRIELGGSFYNPYIQHPRDFDLLVIVKNEEIRKQLYNFLAEDRNTKRFCYSHQFNIKVKIEDDNIINCPSLYLICYEQEGCKILYGQRSHYIYQHLSDLYSNPQYYNYCKDKAQELYNYYCWHKQCRCVRGSLKNFYHLYMIKCILSNHSIILSEQEIQKLNWMHDLDIDHYKIVLQELVDFYQLEVPENGKCNTND